MNIDTHNDKLAGVYSKMLKNLGDQKDSEPIIEAPTVHKIKLRLGGISNLEIASPLSADLPGWKNRLKEHFKGVKRRIENDKGLKANPDFFAPKTKLIQLFKWWR